MSGHRGRQSRGHYGPRPPQHSGHMPNAWVREEDLNPRRQNMPFQSFNPNRMQSPHLNQLSSISGFNKSYPDVNCKIPNINMTQDANSSIFDSPQNVPKSAYPNRFNNERFAAGDGFNNMNVPYRMNEGPPKDYRGPNAAMPNCRSDPFLDPVSKPLHANVRQMQDRYSCMQSNQSQFPTSSQMFQGKHFPFISDKSLFPSTDDPFCSKAPNAAENPCSRSFKASNLFPAYAPQKESPSSGISPKSLEHSAFTSNFIERPNTFVDSPQISTAYTKPSMSIEDRSYHEKALEKAIDELLQSNSSISAFDKQSFKEIPGAQLPFDEIVSPQNIGCASSSFSLSPPKSQESCFQSSGSMSFQKSTSLTPNSLNVASSQSCFMQNTQFPGRTEVHQSLKDCISSSSPFNFESSISTTDIADLLPGIDAFVETLAKSDLVSKSDQTSAFSTDLTWSKPSIPFIGESSALTKNTDTVKNEECNSQDIPLGEKLPQKSEFKETSKSDLTVSTPDNKFFGSDGTEVSVEKGPSKAHSALEEALEMLVTNDAIVGLDYIIEFKKNINQKGSFPFKCTLCNSAISRPTIIDHIVGPKHRIRYLKIKDESKYEEIKALKVERSEKDAKVAEASFLLEKLYGRGHVIVEVDENPRGNSIVQNTPVEEEKEEPVTVFTLDKIPIGFEALSPNHDDSSSFILDPTLSQEAINPGKDKTDEAVTKPKSETFVKSESTGTVLDFGSSDSSKGVLSSSVTEDHSLSNTEKPALTDEAEPHPEKPLQVKRSASPDSVSSSKHLKVATALHSEVSDAPADGDIKVKSELTDSSFNPGVLEALSKCSIASDEEAEFALKAVNVLLQMFLQYQLKHVSIEAVQNMMKGLQCGSSIKTEELLTLLNKNNPSCTKEEASQKSEAVTKEETQQAGATEASEVKPPAPKPDDYKSSTTTSSIGSTTPTESSASASTVSLPLPPPPPVNSTANVPDHRASQTNASMCLNPMSFFNWPQANPLQNSPVAAVPGGQNMMWATNPFQTAQPQYSQMSYFQPQNFATVPQGNQMFQNQFAMLPQNNIQMTPPLPPPLPPMPCNPPLPPSSSSAPLPNSLSFSNLPIPPPPPLS